jgi:hypothetical protein
MLPKHAVRSFHLAILKGSEMNKKTLARYGASALALASVSSFAALDAAITTGVGDAVADILLVVALGGAAFVTISSAGVVWGVASKFIKRLGNKS